MTLYDLNIQFQTLLEMAEDGELDPETIRNTIEAVEGEWEVKLDSYGIVKNELTGDMSRIDAEIKRLTAKKKSLQGNIDRIDQAVLESMRLHDKRKVEGEHFTWTIAKNGGKCPIIFKEGYNLLSIPERFQDWSVKPDKDAIREALEKGGTA